MISFHNKGHNVLIMLVGEVPTDPYNPIRLTLLSSPSASHKRRISPIQWQQHILGAVSPFQYMLYQDMFVNSAESAIVMLTSI